jgi:cytochrome c2
MRRALIVLAFALAGAGCGDGGPPATAEGDKENGRLLLTQFGCGTCHEIPGVARARGRVGPPLEGLASRVYIAGVLPNTPENVAAFIREPRRHAPRTTMPDLGVTQPHARDMAAYLGTLR